MKVLNTDKKFYVYIYLDIRKPGKYKYSTHVFNFEPFYVGKGTGDRAKEHLKYHNSPIYFHNKIKKIISEVNKNPKVIIYKRNLTEKEAYDYEIYLIKVIGRANLKKGPLTNLTDGGDGFRGQKFTEKHKQNLSIAHMGLPSARKGKKCSEEVKEKIRKKLLGKPLSEETKRKISLSKKGQVVSEETRKKLSVASKGKIPPMLGKKHSEETKKKISLSHMGISTRHSEETKKKIGENSKRLWQNQEYRNKVINSITGKKRSPESKIRARKKSQELWQNQEYRNKVLLSRS